MMKRALLLLATVFLATIVAAGVSAANAPAAKAAGGGKVRKCGGGKIFLNVKEKKTFRLHNRVRKQHKLKRFCVHPRLQKAARVHSKDMIRRDYFSHNTKGRSQSACGRIKRFGYRWRVCGENIAWGSGSYSAPKRTMRNWMKSRGHRRNILNGKFREIGIGAYTGTYKGHKNATMYTADFGTRR